MCLPEFPVYPKAIAHAVPGAHAVSGAHAGAPLPKLMDRDGDVGADLCVCPDSDHSTKIKGAHAGAPLPMIVQWFKTMTTNEYIRGVKISFYEI